MTVRHLEILQAVAQTGSFTRAAERLYLTQSAVSHAVRELEEQAGTALCERLPKSVRLTSVGRELLEQAQPVLRGMQTLQQRLEHLEREAPIQIVSSITIGAYWLPEILRRFATLWPRVTVRVQIVSAANALELLRAGKADFALVEGNAPQGPFESRVFDAYALCVAAAPPLAARWPRLTLEQLCDQPLLLREPGSAIRDVFDSALYLNGLSARPVWESVNSPALLAAARVELGFTVLPRLLLADAFAAGTLAQVEVSQLHLQNALLAVWHRDKCWNRPQQALLDQILQKNME